MAFQYNIKNLSNKSHCLISFNYSKIKTIPSLPYKNLGQIFLVLARITHIILINDSYILHIINDVYKRS
jgi:hypothetical protein